MRPPIVPFLLVTMLLSSCANQGVIVAKEARPFPMYLSLGVDGMYAFLVRDNTGVTRRQMVSPEVFESYAVGQYFNDQQPASPYNDRYAEPKTVTVASPRPSTPIRRATAKRSQKPTSLQANRQKDSDNKAASKSASTPSDSADSSIAPVGPGGAFVANDFIY